MADRFVSFDPKKAAVYAQKQFGDFIRLTCPPEDIDTEILLESVKVLAGHALDTAGMTLGFKYSQYERDLVMWSVRQPWLLWAAYDAWLRLRGHDAISRDLMNPRVRKIRLVEIIPPGLAPKDGFHYKLVDEMGRVMEGPL